MVNKKKPEKKSNSKANSKSKTSKTKKKLVSKETEQTNPLGKKHTCYNCGTKFYDLNKEQVICPKCGADQNSKPALKQKLRISLKYSEFEVAEDEIPEELDEELELEGEELEEPILEDEEEV